MPLENRPGTLLTVTVALAAMLCVACAEEPSVIKARLILDKVESRLEALKPGDAALAAKLIEDINSAKEKLGACKDQHAKEWTEQAVRANALDPMVRARLEGSDGSAVEADEATLAAVRKLDEVEAALAGLKAGDVPAANTLIHEINASRDLLGKSQLRTTPEWIASRDRATALDARVRAIAAGKAEPPAGGTTPAREADAGAGPLGTNDAYILRSQFTDPLPGYRRQLEQMDASALDDWRRQQLVDAAGRMRKQLARISQQRHPQVVDAYTQLDAFERAVDEKAQVGKRVVAEAAASAAAEASEVDAELAKIEAFFDPASFSCDLEPPYSAERVREWVSEIRRYEAMGEKGTAQLARLVQERPAYADDPRVKRLGYVFSDTLPKRLARSVARVTDWEQIDSTSKRQGELLSRMERARHYLQPDAVTGELLKQDDWLNEALEQIGNGIEAAEAMVVFQDAYSGQPARAAAALAADLRALEQRVAKEAERVIAGVRMPEARSTSAELLEIAAETIDDPGYGAGPRRRLVINADKKHHREEKAEARLVGETIRVQGWIEDWDQFQACAAEEVDGALRLVYYTLKYLHQGPSWMPVGRWYVKDRFVSTRILAENVNE